MKIDGRIQKDREIIVRRRWKRRPEDQKEKKNGKRIKGEICMRNTAHENQERTSSCSHVPTPARSRNYPYTNRVRGNEHQGANNLFTAKGSRLLRMYNLEIDSNQALFSRFHRFSRRDDAQKGLERKKMTLL